MNEHIHHTTKYQCYKGIFMMKIVVIIHNLEVLEEY